MLDDLTAATTVDELRDALTRIIALAHALQEAKLAGLLAGLSTDELIAICHPIVAQLRDLCEAALAGPTASDTIN